MKKGQITVFVILGILIVLGIFSFVFMKSMDRKSKIDADFFASLAIKPEINNIQSSVFNCMNNVCREGLETIGIQGGYYEKPYRFLDLGWAFVPYYYYEGEIFMPSEKTIQFELSKYVDDRLVDCLDEIDSENFNINYRTPKTKTYIHDADVEFEIDLPVKIEKEGHKLILELEDYPIMVDSALRDILEVANYYTLSHKEDPAMYCINCLGEMVEERDLYVEISSLNQSRLFLIFENRTASEPYYFEFLNKYTGDEQSPDYKIVTPDSPNVK